MDISYHLGIGPAQQDELTVVQWQEAVVAVQQIRDEIAKQTA